MKANEAYLLAQDAIRIANVAFEARLPELFGLIKKAAQEGSMSVTIEERLEDYLVKKLRGLGYTVEFGSQYNVSYTTISWSSVPTAKETRDFYNK